MSWWYATSPRATFAFQLDDQADRIIVCAPIGSSWLMGRSRQQAKEALLKRGYVTTRLK